MHFELPPLSVYGYVTATCRLVYNQELLVVGVIYSWSQTLGRCKNSDNKHVFNNCLLTSNILYFTNCAVILSTLVTAKVVLPSYTQECLVTIKYAVNV